MPECFKYNKVTIPQCWLFVLVETNALIFKCIKITTIKNIEVW